jgi:hypothetical protein
LVPGCRWPGNRPSVTALTFYCACFNILLLHTVY